MKSLSFWRRIDVFLSVIHSHQIALSTRKAFACTIAALLFCAVSSIHAATIVVDAGVVEEALDGNCSLSEAIRAANENNFVDGCTSGNDSNNGGDIIDLPTRVYTLVDENEEMNRGLNGLPIITSVIDVQGNFSTIERDNSAPQFRIFEVSSSGNLILNNLTLSGGQIDNNGGGIYNDGGTLTINNSTITSNQAINSQHTGGGIYNNSGTLNVINSAVSGNTAAGHGGGIRHEDQNNDAFTIISGSTISGNMAGLNGGGIYSDSNNDLGSTTLTISNSTIVNNVASQNGGGIAHDGSGRVEVGSSTIKSNQADPSSSNTGIGFGGGIYNNLGVLVIVESTVSGNSADDHGGGLYNSGQDGSGSATLTNSTVSGNSAPQGGGIFSGTPEFPTPIPPVATLTLNNVTVAENNDGNAGFIPSGTGLYANGDITLNFSIIGQNTPGSEECSFDNGFGGSVTFDNSLIDNSIDAGSCSGTGNVILAAPMLNPLLTDNGGLTETHALQDDSPAINPITTPDSGSCAAGVTTDQRGAARDTDCDLGAFEKIINASPEVVMNISDIFATVNEVIPAIDLTIVFNDAEDGPTGLTYEVNGNGSLFTDPASLLSGSILNLGSVNMVGMDTITVQAEDSLGEIIAETFNVTITSAEIPTVDDLANADSLEISMIPVDTFAALDSLGISVIPPEAIGGMTPEQFQSLSDEALFGFSSEELGFFSLAVIKVIDPQDYAAFNRDEVSGAPAKVLLRLLLNANLNMIGPGDIMSVLPSDWGIDMSSGKLRVPAGTPLAFKSLPMPDDLPDNLKLPTEPPDFSTSFGLGGEGGMSLLDSFNEALAMAGADDLDVEQMPTGNLMIKGSGEFEGVELSFMPDQGNLMQGEGSPGVGVMPGEQFVVTNMDGQEFPLVPAPIDPKQISDLISSIDDSFATIGTEGEVIVKLGDDVLVLLFDAFTTPNTGLPFGVFPSNTARRMGAPLGQVVFGNGSAQQVFPYIPAPGVFKQTTLAAFPFLTDVIINQNDGTALATFDGGSVTLIPQSTILNPGGNAPSVVLNPDLTLDYEVQTGLEELLSNIAVTQ